MSINYEAFVHRIDKSQIPACNIMGVNIAAIDMDWLLQFTFRNIRELSGDYCCVSNVHTTVMAWEDRDYCAIQNGVLCTGISKGYRHFFYGSTEETLGKIRERLTAEYPHLQIAGMYAPPFRTLEKEEDLQVTRMINESNADFVWVGLGAPRQEIWMAQHQGKMKGFMVGVGAGFDYLAGNIDRAPRWMQEHNLEWLYRLWQDPGRLWKRYMKTNMKFIWNAYLLGR